MSEYFNKDGRRITPEEWRKLFADTDYRRIAYTELTNSTTVSTVWLGLPHGHSMNGPLIFETMVNEDGGWEAQYRYSTLDEALAGHLNRVYSFSDGDAPTGEESRWSQISNEEEDF